MRRVWPWGDGTISGLGSSQAWGALSLHSFIPLAIPPTRGHWVTGPVLQARPRVRDTMAGKNLASAFVLLVGSLRILSVPGIWKWHPRGLWVPREGA